jgi:hypothetical protein
MKSFYVKIIKLAGKHGWQYNQTEKRVKPFVPPKAVANT